MILDRIFLHQCAKKATATFAGNLKLSVVHLEAESYEAFWDAFTFESIGTCTVLLPATIQAL